MADATWYRLEFDGTGERFVEVELDADEVKDAIQRSAVVQALRQVIAVPVRDDQGRTGISFASIEKFSPLVSGCVKDTEHVNLGRVVGFAQVDTTSKMWQSVKESALGEPGIVTPPQGLVIPGD